MNSSQATIAGGIIPAYAGSTRSTTALCARGRDHPRIRGEHVHRCIRAHGARGSSPHTRGAPDLGHLPEVHGGIIPAYAGSTQRHSATRKHQRDHPRIRGEHGSYSNAVSPASGSSPHTRGAPAIRSLLSTMVGIIPAYAGSTCRAGATGLSTRDHPRIRGEHFRQDQAPALMAGSSPHTRGARPDVREVAHGNGIIPAYAGSTTAPPRPGTPGGDHPRIRGEHWFQQLPGNIASGSSPHTRGALDGRAALLRPVGIIPAYAGST